MCLLEQSAMQLCWRDMHSLKRRLVSVILLHGSCTFRNRGIERNHLSFFNPSYPHYLFTSAMSAIRVLVSGAAGNIGYAILPMIVRLLGIA